MQLYAAAPAGSLALTAVTTVVLASGAPLHAVRKSGSLIGCAPSNQGPVYSPSTSARLSYQIPEPFTAESGRSTRRMLFALVHWPPAGTVTVTRGSSTADRTVPVGRRGV